MGENGSTCFASDAIELRLSPAGFGSWCHLFIVCRTDCGLGMSCFPCISVVERRSKKVTDPFRSRRAQNTRCRFGQLAKIIEELGEIVGEEKSPHK